MIEMADETSGARLSTNCRQTLPKTMIRFAPPNIRLINADGTGERRLTAKSAYAMTPSFSPDGQAIAFSRVVDTSRLFGNASIVTSAG